MRRFPAALVITALTAAAAFAQVRGEVESIGFGGNGWYRPESMTPMVVRLESQIDDTAEYRIEVHQRDLDFDHVIYVKDGITLNGRATQRWELCFLPDPTGGGLPESSLAELQERLRVYLTDKDGSHRLLELPITSTVQSLEPIGGAFNAPRGMKLILYVAERGSRPSWSEFDGAIGLNEPPVPVRIAVRDLPQSAPAYQAVDAVVWVDGDARQLSEQGSTQLAALQKWVRLGGTLIVCQPGNDGERQTIAPFADMLPILWQRDGVPQVSVQTKTDLEPLKTLAAWKLRSIARPVAKPPVGPFRFARATALPDAIVDEWIDWDAQGTDRTPYIARHPYGLGSVTWVAQDLGDPAITGPGMTGWPYVWDRVFGWKNDLRIKDDYEKRDEEAVLPGLTSMPIDLGASQLRGVEFPAKGAGLISLALIFFVIYWLVAGPGTFLVLMNRHRREKGWLLFAVEALAATVLTVAVVRIVLRGSPEIRHATDVRVDAGDRDQPAVALSRIGLYIPRDGVQTLSLSRTQPQFVSCLTPMPIFPGYVPDNEFPANLEYSVPVHDEGSTDPVSVSVPFRSTLKKLAARWSGDLPARVQANELSLDPDAPPEKRIHGFLDNVSGVDFRNIYIAFDFNGQDYVLYVPSWAGSGQNRLDLATLYAQATSLPLAGAGGTLPDITKPLRGEITAQWSYLWNRMLQGAGDRLEDLTWPMPVSFPVLSFYDRIPPAKNVQDVSRAMTLLRRGGRALDLSGALAAGDLIVLTQADHRPLPFPFQVNGDPIGGDGTIFYQFAFPLNRIHPAETDRSDAATQPSVTTERPSVTTEPPSVTTKQSAVTTQGRAVTTRP